MIDVRPILEAAKKHQRLEKFLQQGANRATKRAATAARAEMARAIKAEFNLGKTQYSGVASIKRAFKIRQRRDSGVVIRGRVRKGIPLRDFGGKKTRGGVTFKIRRRGGGRRVLRGGFQVRTIGSHIFTREGRSRLPIRKRYGPDIVQMSDDRLTVVPRTRRAFFERVGREIPLEEQRAFKRAGL